MLILLALPVIVTVAAMHRYLQSYAPTNVLTHRVRSREPQWWAIPVLVGVAAAFFVAMHALGEAVASGAAGWLNLVVLVLAWDAIKIAVLAMIQVVRCGRRSIARYTRVRTCVRRRAFQSDTPSRLRVCP